MARTDRKQREFETREQDILDAALELFSQPNWESVSIERIAGAADVGKGTVYKHFASKDELLFRLMLRFYKGLLHIIKTKEAPESDVIAQFRNSFFNALQYHDTHRKYRYVIEYCKRIDFREKAEGDWHASFIELDDAFADWATPRLETGIAQGLLEKRPVESIRIGLHACFDGAVNLLWAGRAWCIEDDKDTIFNATLEFLMAGLIGRK